MQDMRGYVKEDVDRVIELRQPLRSLTRPVWEQRSGGSSDDGMSAGGTGGIKSDRDLQVASRRAQVTPADNFKAIFIQRKLRGMAATQNAETLWLSTTSASEETSARKQGRYEPPDSDLTRWLTITRETRYQGRGVLRCPVAVAAAVAVAVASPRASRHAFRALRSGLRMTDRNETQAAAAGK
jgi:hypothetical protein